MSESALELITELCRRAPSDRFESKARSVQKLRSKAYEILLRKSETPAPRSSEDPAVELLSYYFAKTVSKRSVSDFRNVQLLKQNLDLIFDQNLQERIPYFNEILTCIVTLRDSVPDDRGKRPFNHTFTLEQLDAIIPPVAYTAKNEPKPYLHIPWQFFQPQFNILNSNCEHPNEPTPYPYSTDEFTARPGTKLLRLNPSLTCDRTKSDSPKEPSSYIQSFEELQSFPRLSSPRDLSIPDEKPPSKNIIFKTHSDNCPLVNQNTAESGPPATLWELASLENVMPPDIWEEAAKLPPSVKRPFISSSSSQMVHWKKSHRGKIKQIHVISESQFILHLKYLTMGIHSNSFIYDLNLGKFIMKPGLCLEGISQITLRSYVVDLIKTGSCYRMLNDLVSTSSKTNEQDGFVYKATRDSIRQYLVWFRLEMDKIFGDGLVTIEHENARLPTLTEIIQKLKPLGIQIQTMARIYRVYETDRYLGGAGLMACLYNEIISLTNNNVSKILYSTLKSTCTVYFRFIQEFIFEGELNDRYNEFFIEKEEHHVESFNKRYWDKGFIIRSDEVIPEFLRGMAKYILLCGKSLRLLKLCNPNHPLCIMLSSNYPEIKCCLTFDEIEDQQTLYDQYRTQCLYVCGEPVTFHSLMIQKDIERRTFREILALKQAETMEKLIDERKRLSRMIHGNKKKQFSILKEAVESAIAKRKEEKEKNIKEEKLLLNLSLAAEKKHQLNLEKEKKEVVLFYEKIEKEVEKRQTIADWKIKRLKLDQKRLELITGEKLDLNREQLELKYIHTKSDPSLNLIGNKNSKSNDEAQLDSNAFSNYENTTPTKDKNNAMQLNIENNNINEINNQIEVIKTSALSQLSDINKNLMPNSEESNRLSISDIVNSNILTTTDKYMDAYKQQRHEALKNKQKVLSHEFGVDLNEQSTAHFDNQNPHIYISSELKRNKIKVLGSSLNNNNDVSTVNNFQEVSQFDTDASRQALKNKQKILGHEFGIVVKKPPQTRNNKRDNLTLDLQKSKESATLKLISGNFTSNNLMDTPVDFPIALDVETPSNFEIGPFGLPSNAISSLSSVPLPEITNEPTSKYSNSFSFPNIIEEYISDGDTTPDGGPKEINFTHNDESSSHDVKSTVWNFVNDELNFDNFKPFGIESVAQNQFSFDLFKSSFSLEKSNLPYSNINEIISKAKNKPMKDIFKMIDSQEDMLVVLNTIDNVDLSSMAMCLQRSIMIPLSCQMEMVNNAILKYFLADCDLYEHLKNIRDFFFLMDGEFAKSFCSNLFEKLNVSRNPKDLLNFAMLHKILRKSHESSFGGTNKYIDNLSFVAADMPTTFHYASPNILECLSLTYSAAWPLNIILSQEAMERYGKIFKFLVKLRRISWVLEHDSEVLKMSLKEEFMISRELLFSPQYRSVQLYRYTMSSLMRALHGYILNTCLQSSWVEFEKDMSDARTLDDLYSSHVIYIKKVLFRCLLNNRSTAIMKTLNTIFCVILNFHHSLNSRCWHMAENEIHYTHPLFSEMRELFASFEKLARHFHKTVTKLVDCGYQPHLAELLSMINMNDYYRN